MSRLKADLLMLLTALIWGAAFVAQKNAFDHVGPCTFVAARFFISMLLVMPFSFREYKRHPDKLAPEKKNIALLCLCFCAGVLLQQIGVGKTTVSNAGFLTGLYVVFVPMVCTLVYNQRLSRWVFVAAFLSVAGIWLLSGGVSGFTLGDGLVFLCAIGFGFQVTLIGRIVQSTKSPLSLSFLQYGAATLVAAIGAMLFEHVTLTGLQGALLPILYAGVMSGGIAYTLQNIAQQYTPASDAAIILSGESVFAALSGAWLLGERLTPTQYAGCALIAIAIVVTEVMPLLIRKKSKA